MTSKQITALTIADWRHKGFTFEDACSDRKYTVITYGGKSFHFCLFRTLADHWGLEHTMGQMQRVERAEVAGHWQLREDAVFPYYLVPDETWAKMVEAREVIRQLEAALPHAREALSTALLDPLNYRKASFFSPTQT